MLELKIWEDRHAKTDKRFFINLFEGSGFWHSPIGNNSKIGGMSKEQSIELRTEILKTVKNYLEKEFSEKKDDEYFLRSFENINPNKISFLDVVSQIIKDSNNEKI